MSFWTKTTPPDVDVTEEVDIYMFELWEKTTPPDEDLTEVDLNELWVRTTPPDEDLIEVAFQLPVMKAHLNYDMNKDVMRCPNFRIHL